MKNFIKINILLIILFSSKLYGATDKYRIIINNNPSTTITIAWNQVSGENPIVYYGTEDLGQNAEDYPFQKSVDRIEDFRGMNNQFARIEGLQANTAYYFVIKDSEDVSERFWFITAPSDKSRLSFLAGGDSRNNREPRQKANLLVSKLKPHAVLFGGDMTSSDNSSQWQDWFEDWQLTTASDGRMFPIVATRGNHEQPGTVNKLFDTPQDDSYYAVTFGDNFLRTYTLNTEISVYGNQLDWLETDLENHTEVTWKMVQYHKPMRPHTSGKPEGIDRYNAWSQLFYDNAVRLVVECDSHVNKTTYPIKPSQSSEAEEGFEIDEERGTVYTGEGCWGAPLRDNDDDKIWTRGSGSFNQIKWIFVSEEEIELRTLSVTNAEEVAEVSNDNPFEIPQNLSVWVMPDSEEVVYIHPLSVIPKAEFQFSEDMHTEFVEPNNIQINVDILNPGNGIASISYRAVNLSNDEEIVLGTVTAEPYNINVNLPESGQYKIHAMAKTVDNMETEISKIINVGEFTIEKSFRILSDNNDVEEGETTGYMYFGSSDLELGFDSHNDQNYQKVGVRFTELNIPKKATINSCKIRFTSKKDRDVEAETTIYVENTPNPLAYSDEAFNLSTRNFMANQVTWELPPWEKYDCGDNTTSPELSSFIQPLINDSNWEMGNAISLMLKPSGPSIEDEHNKRYAYSYGGDVESAPELLVDFYYNVSDHIDVENIESSLKVYLMPNPSSSIFHLIFEKGTDKDLYAYISNNNGMMIQENIIKSNTVDYSINLELQPKGMYFLNVVDKKGNLIIKKKLIKE